MAPQDQDQHTKGEGKLRGFFITTGAIALVVLLGAAVVTADSWKDRLVVRTVHCEGNRIVPGAELLRLAGIAKESKLYALDLGTIQRRVALHPYVKSVYVKRELPADVVIVIDERQPIAALVQGGLVYLTADGVVLPAITSDLSFDLPFLTGKFPAVEPGKKLADSAAREALSVLAIARQGSEECYRRISEVHVSDDHDLLLYTNEGGVPVYFGRGETAMKLAKLDTFWDEMGRSAGELQYVDLRFQNQVIARWNRN